MLTVFREMAHSLTRQLAHLSADKQRLGRDVSEEQQDAILAEVLERAIADGERAVARTPEQLEVLRESGVVDAGGHGLVLILAGVVAGLRGDGAPLPEVSHREPPKLTRPHHEDSRYRYCTNFIVSGTRARRPRGAAAAGGARRLGPRRRRRSDAEGPRPHRHAGGGDGALRGRSARSPTSTSPTCASRWPNATRRLATAAGRTGVVAVAAGEGMERLFAELGADVVAGGETLNPSTSELLGRDPRRRGRGSPGAAELLERDHGGGARLRALREARPGGPGDLPAGEPAGAGRARPGGGARRERRSGSRRRWRTSPPAASPRRPATTPRDASSAATRSASPTARSSPGAAPGRRCWRRSRCSPTDAEIVTVIGGDGAPIPLEEIDAHVPDGVELEKHEGGQPSWWWLLAAQ